MQLLNALCELFGPSGNEIQVRDFLIEYTRKNQHQWCTKPKLVYGDGFQDNLMLMFGKPRTAVFAHMDSHGFMVRYEDQIIPIGSPEIHEKFRLVGKDSKGPIECGMIINKNHTLKHDFGRAIETGTELVYKCDFKQTKDSVQSCYLDNRLGVYAMLKLAETLTDGIIVFSTWEEHGGGSIPYLARYIHNEYKISQALISDITWTTDGIKPGRGVVISLRDQNIPRRSYLNRIISIAKNAKVKYQLEVEAGGSSDGRELQLSPFPFDWCFVGAAEKNVHSPEEIVHKNDIDSMINFYAVLMDKL